MCTARGRVRDRHRIIEENHDTVAGELIERALILTDQRPQRAVVLVQEVEHLLGLGRLREGGVAAQIAEHDDLSATTFKDLLVALLGYRASITALARRQGAPNS